MEKEEENFKFSIPKLPVIIVVTAGFSFFVGWMVRAMLASFGIL